MTMATPSKQEANEIVNLYVSTLFFLTVEPMVKFAPNLI
jgi:hypothetical protein